VTGEVREGEIRPFLIQSLAGAECVVESPWPDHAIAARNLGTGKLLETAGANIAFPTEAGSRYLLFRRGEAEVLPQPPKPRRGPNAAAKEWRGCRLGRPRYF
jgi:hypothetical protein